MRTIAAAPLPLYMHLQSPFYPLAVAAALAPEGPQRVVDVPFPQWILWRFHCVITPQAREAMLALVQDAIAEKVQ